MAGIKGLATGIGSLPYGSDDAHKALDLIFTCTPNIPFWPQFPKLNEEGMVVQFIEHIPCLIPFGKEVVFKESERELETFYEKIINQDTGYFKISKKYSLGLYAFYDRLEKADLRNAEFIKCHITGPFTFAASVKDERGRALFHNSVFMQAVVKGLIMKALWQIKLFIRFGKKIILFVDEPYLGCFGSAYTPVNREDVVKTLTELTEGIKSDNVLTGIHCCGNTDWSIFTEIKTLDIINFDAFSFMDKFVLYAPNLNDFLTRGGIICWGIVPTQEFTGNETADMLLGKIRKGVDVLVEKGIDRDLLLDSMIISPACGLGALDTGKAEQIFKLLHKTSLLIKKRL